MTAPQLDRARPADPAITRLETALQLADELTDVVRATDRVLAGVEDATGLRRGELAALLAVDGGARHPRAVARRSGQVDDAGDATTAALVRRGLLRRGRHPDAPPGAAGATALEVTEAGRVVLQQAEGLRIRMLESLVGALGPRDTAVLRTAAHVLTGALDGAAGTAREGCRENDSRPVVPVLGP
jgi:DNA-binding MarR family transcriptional regulator